MKPTSAAGVSLHHDKKKRSNCGPRAQITFAPRVNRVRDLESRSSRFIECASPHKHIACFNATVISINVDKNRS
jgi:hypothetical protein